MRLHAFGLPGAQGVARGRLNLYHLGTEVAEDLRQHIAGKQTRHVQNAHAVQRPSRIRREVALLEKALLGEFVER
jgi:hypothetical protein